jgi:hypothetical protein
MGGPVFTFFVIQVVLSVTVGQWWNFPLFLLCWTASVI